MNRIRETFIKKKNILSIYFTAGYPNLNDTMVIIKELDKSGVDMTSMEFVNLEGWCFQEPDWIQFDMSLRRILEQFRC